MSERLSEADLADMRDMDRRANEGECDTDDLLAMLPDVVRAVDELRAARVVVEAAKAWRATTGHEASDHMLLNQRDARRALLDAIDALAGAK